MVYPFNDRLLRDMRRDKITAVILVIVIAIVIVLSVYCNYVSYSRGWYSYWIFIGVD